MYIHKRQQQQKQLRVILFVCPCNALMQWMLRLVIRRRPVESKKSQQLKMINKLLEKNLFFFFLMMGGCCVVYTTQLVCGLEGDWRCNNKHKNSHPAEFGFVLFFPSTLPLNTKVSLINVLQFVMLFFVFIFLKARSKLPKKRRSVLPVEQIRRKQQQPNRNDGVGGGGLQRRMNAFKHNPPAMLLKDAMAVTFGAGKYYTSTTHQFQLSWLNRTSSQVWLQNNVIPAGACNNVNNVVTAATATAANKLMPGCANSVASIQVQPMLPGRPSSAFDFTALGLMAKIIGTIKWYFDVFQMT